MCQIHKEIKGEENKLLTITHLGSALHLSRFLRGTLRYSMVTAASTIWPARIGHAEPDSHLALLKLVSEVDESYAKGSSSTFK